MAGMTAAVGTSVKKVRQIPTTAGIPVTTDKPTTAVVPVTTGTPKTAGCQKQ
jgi:hypothetical protein